MKTNEKRFVRRRRALLAFALAFAFAVGVDVAWAPLSFYTAFNHSIQLFIRFTSCVIIVNMLLLLL